MRQGSPYRALGLWLAGLAVGFKVILAAFAAAPTPALGSAEGAFPGTQVICTGSGFLILETDAAGETKASSLGHCPLCLAAALLLFAEAPPALLALLLFAVALTFRIGSYRPKRQRPPSLGFFGRAPPLPL